MIIPRHAAYSLAFGPSILFLILFLPSYFFHIDYILYTRSLGLLFFNIIFGYFLIFGGIMATIAGLYFILNKKISTTSTPDDWSWGAFFFPQIFSLVYRLWRYFFFSLTSIVLVFFNLVYSIGAVLSSYNNFETIIKQILLSLLLPLTHLIITLPLAQNGINLAREKAVTEALFKKRKIVTFSLILIMTSLFFILFYYSLKDGYQKKQEYQKRSNTTINIDKK